MSDRSASKSPRRKNGKMRTSLFELMLDKMSAHCAALSVTSGDKKYIDGACVLTDTDKIFSTFDTRDVD